MTQDQEMAAALAAADRQRALAIGALNHVIQKAAQLLSFYGDETKAWALLAEDIKRQLDCDGRSYFAAEMVAAAAIRLAVARQH